MKGIPVIAFDPQGDISSLAVLAEENDQKDGQAADGPVSTCLRGTKFK